MKKESQEEAGLPLELQKDIEVVGCVSFMADEPRGIVAGNDRHPSC
jgi:hypothetical protein